MSQIGLVFGQYGYYWLMEGNDYVVGCVWWVIVQLFQVFEWWLGEVLWLGGMVYLIVDMVIYFWVKWFKCYGMDVVEYFCLIDWCVWIEVCLVIECVYWVIQVWADQDMFDCFEVIEEEIKCFFGFYICVLSVQVVGVYCGEI